MWRSVASARWPSGVAAPPRRAWALFWGGIVGVLLWIVAPAVQGDGLFHLARVRKLLDLDKLSLDRVSEFADGSLHPGYAFPLWHGFIALIAKLSGEDPGARRRPSPVDPRPDRRRPRVRGGVGAVPPDLGGGGHALPRRSR